MKLSITSSKAVYLKPDLLKKLDKMIHHRLTIISAAVGYGKTTAVREYIHQKKLPYCWLNVYSQDIHDFWLGFCQLIEKYDREAYSKLIRLGLPRSNTKRQFARIVADIPHPPHTVIVIDDYQRIAGTPADDFIAFLLHELPEDVHLVLISRVQIFDSCEYQLRSEMNRISTSDLALDGQDIYQYYLLNGIALSREQCQWLVEETDGWIAYLYLYVLQYRQFGEFYQNEDNGIIGLIDEIIYSGLSADCKMFLNTLCIVNHFTLPQAEFVSEGELGKQILSELRRKNAFLRYYPATKEYQFHKLFLTCIKHHFMKLEREKQREVYGRMAEWFMHTNGYFSAIKHYFQAEKFDALLEAINKNGYGDLSPYQQKQVISYYQKCPEQIREKNPWAMLFVSYLLYQQRQPYQPLLHKVGSIIQSYSGSPKELAALQSCYELQIALIYHDDYSQSITHYAAAIAYLENGKTQKELPDYFSQKYCPPSILMLLLKKKQLQTM